MPKQQLTKHKCGAHILTALDSPPRSHTSLTLDPTPSTP